MQVIGTHSRQQVGLHAIVQFDLESLFGKVSSLDGQVHGGKLDVGNKAHGDGHLLRILT